MRVYSALKNLIASESDNKPVEGWQENVLEEISRQKPRKAIFRPWVGAIAAGLMVFGIATTFLSELLLQRNPNNQIQANTLELSIIPSNQSYRGDTAKIGDTLLLESKIAPKLDQTDAITLRLYRDGFEHFSCGIVEKCTIVDNHLKQEVLLTAYGEYQAVVFFDGATPSQSHATSTSLETDILQAMDKNQQIIVGQSIDVR